MTDILATLILESAPNSLCNYADHSVPMRLDRGPCGFTYTDDFMPSPPAPNVVCNGKCVAPGACPSSNPLPQRRWVGSGSCPQMGHGWAACGVFGGGARAWECVDTAHDLESYVACHSGECIVRRCLLGYVVSHDGTSCRSKHTHSHVATPEEDDEYVEAMHYGLEHRPL
ncbi:hypothetical protein H4582DRAFT_2119791 [Lactarius indigo]|nr:hypothetical protein H4582DRAFT_2119791 [Lactarius indigo]